VDLWCGVEPEGGEHGVTGGACGEFGPGSGCWRRSCRSPLCLVSAQQNPLCF